VLRDFVRVLNPSNFHSTIVGWNRRWLLRLDGNERQKVTLAACSNLSGEVCRYHSHACWQQHTSLPWHGSAAAIAVMLC
jgi:hypothetical protein